MRYLAFATPQCTEEAKRYGLSDEVQKLCEKVESDQSIGNWDSFLPTPYVKKKLGTYRIVAEKRPFGDDVIICLLAVSPRGGRYEDFLASNRTTWESRCPGEAELETFLAGRVSLPEPFAQPSEAEYAYLFSHADTLDGTEGLIFETRDWVTSIAEAQFQKHLLRFSELVIESLKVENHHKGVLIHDRGAERILFATVDVEHYPGIPATVLIAPLLGAEAREGVLTSQYNDIRQGNPIQLTDLLRRCGRVYPSLIASDETIWCAIESSQEGNLALSPEESRILEAIRIRTGDSVFPLFINGRPGSGKSTILQYLFADYLHKHLWTQAKLDYPPLYLTYSNTLLAVARQSVEAILRCNSQKALEPVDLSTPEAQQVLSSSFMQFRGLLVSLLPDSDQAQYDWTKRVDFLTFRSRFVKHFSMSPDADVRRLSPELAWHVVRTYVKGMREDSQSEFDLDRYQELPSKQKTVSNAIFELVFREVWQKWYRPLCESERLWDDQDLARRVLDLPTNISRYPVVFCDEAQDFTKIELELILRLSLFAQRNIPSTDLRLVPLAFAGDPFQTLNPTGFDWSSVQAGFYEKIIEGLDKGAAGHLKFNYQSLSVNYRSSRGIVHLCNLIQLLRGILFDKKNLQPQQTWFEEDSPPPAAFDIDDPSCQSHFEEETELVIILPCQENEEDDYVKRDPFLSRFPERNFLSAMRAKGLEFSRVVLYKFGEDYCQNYPILLEPLMSEDPHADPETALPLEYFMNRLYVGASRAQKRLFIVDSDRGIQQFWRSRMLQEVDSLLARYEKSAPFSGQRAWTRDDITVVQPGFESSWTEDRDDPIKLGELFRKDGIAQRDPYKLEKARWNFKRAGKQQEALDCEAKKYEVEERFSTAGEKYILLRKWDDALRCFWFARDYNRISEEAHFLQSLEGQIALFMVSRGELTACQGLLDLMLNEINGNLKYRICSEPQFSEAIERVVTWVNKIEDHCNWSEMYNRIKRLEELGLKPKQSQNLAELSFMAGDYRGAKEIWEANKITSGDHFQCAKDHVLVDDWESHRSNRSQEISDEVAKAYIRLERYDDALGVLREHPTEHELERLVDATGSHKDAHVGALAELVKVKVANKQWREALLLAENVNYSEKLGPVFVRALAQPDNQLDTRKDRDQIAKYLRRRFIESWDGTVKMIVAGAAIEKACRIIDSLQFYERVWREKVILCTPEEENLARQRWYKCKLRQVDLRKDSREGEQYFKEAEDFREHYRLNSSDIPEFPTMSELRHGATLPGRNRLTPTQRTMVEASFKSGISPQAIADEMHISLADVEMVLRGIEVKNP